MDPPPTNAPGPEPSTFAHLLPLLPTYAHLLFGALLPILTGAHASLKRPKNVLSPAQLRQLRSSGALQDDAGSEDPEEDNDDEEDDDEEDTPIENLTAGDAILFPITAGLMLGALYLILKYLNDPTLLSRILTWYFSIFGIFAVGRCVSDMAAVYFSYIFPRRYRARSGSGLFVLDARKRCYVSKSTTTTTGEEVVEVVKNPFGDIVVPEGLWAGVWELRKALEMKWVLTVKLREKAVFKKSFWIGDLVGLVVGAVVIALYSFLEKHWVLSNAMGIAFAYGSMQLISPTTFPIATLLLSLLFFYDIFFVFYTPLMITVATNLDVPIKLMFPRPSTSSGKPALAMLGLGDIVLPGLVMSMALRWDLWRFYEQKRLASLSAAAQKKPNLEPPPPPNTSTDTKETPESAATAATAAETAAVAEKKLVHLLAKPRFQKVTSLWGDRFWTRSPSPFPKTYFKASIVGYTAGMITTLGVMHIFHHAQPALLYLVPGVLGAVWGTAVLKGEVGVMWGYSEEEDEEQVKVEAGEKPDDNVPPVEEVKEKDEEEDEDEKEKVWLSINIIPKPTFLPTKRTTTNLPPPPPPQTTTTTATTSSSSSPPTEETETESESGISLLREDRPSSSASSSSGSSAVEVEIDGLDG